MNVSEFNQMVLQRLRISSKCFWKVNLKSKVIPRNFTWGQILSLSPYRFRMGSEFLAREDLRNMMTLFFQDWVLFSIWHTTLPVLVGPYKSFTANCTFLIAAHRAVSSGNWDFEFCLWWGFGKSLTYIRKSNGLRTEPCGTPGMGLILSERKPFTLTWLSRTTRKSESQHVTLVGRSSMKILYLSPLCQTLSKAFSTSRKAATTRSSLLKLSITDRKSLKRW